MNSSLSRIYFYHTYQSLQRMLSDTVVPLQLMPWFKFIQHNFFNKKEIVLIMTLYTPSKLQVV